MTPRLIVLIVCFGLAILSFGCVAETPTSTLVPMPTGNQEMEQELLVELDDRGIWYRELDDSHIEVENKNTAQIATLFDSIIRNTLPRGRSFSPAPRVFEELSQSLENQGVVCKPVSAFDKEWLVCRNEDMKLVDDTLTEIVTRP